MEEEKKDTVENSEEEKEDQPVQFIAACNNCFYFNDAGRYECRAEPPSIDSRGIAQWPLIAPGEWCGAHVYIEKVRNSLLEQPTPKNLNIIRGIPPQPQEEVAEGPMIEEDKDND